MNTPAIDDADVQGLVRFAHSQMTEACFFLLRVENSKAACEWLRHAPVTTVGKMDPPPATALQLAFTRQGLEGLHVPQEIIAGFSAEFIAGMAAEESRSRRLGDVGVSAPSEWRWGGPQRIPHVLVMLYARDGLLEGWKQTVKGEFWDSAFRPLECLPTSNLGGVEHFGFVDGISQPEIDWNGEKKPQGRQQLAYSNLASRGEFLLGYRNEYGNYTDRPLVDLMNRTAAELPPADDNPAKRDVGRNGTYLVFRQLRQDVRLFWQFLSSQAGSNPQKALQLAEALVGRRKSGEPLVAATNSRIAGVGPDPDDVKLNQFTFESDDSGIKCPFGAHIRRANPRNGDLPYRTHGLLSQLVRILGFGQLNMRDDLISSVRFHRIVRRGREYGPPLPKDQAIAPAPLDEPERGLNFICLNANIERQFEFVQNAWIMGTKFDGLSLESDPLLGNRRPLPNGLPTDNFSLQQENGARRRITGMPQFVTVRGGAYFFMPGIRALRYLAHFGR